MSCSNVEALETWFLSNLPSCDSKKSAGGECITPFFNFEFPNYCRPDEVSNFYVTRTSTNEFLFQWDAVPTEWNVQRYEILAVASTGGSSTLVVEGSQNNQYLASHLSPDFHLFAIKACVAEQCGDAGEIVTADFGLTRVTGLDVQWIDESAGRFELVWSYPTDTVNGQIAFERPEYFLIEPAAAKNGEASEFTVPVMPGDFPDQWLSDEFLTSNNTNPIYHVRACVNNNSLVRCGPRSSISVVQSVVGSLGEPSNVAVTEQGANSMRLSWTPANSSTVDYYRVNEVLTLEQGDTQPSMTNRVFFTEKESVAIDRERMASYRYRVSACRNVRDGIDECSDPSDFTPNIVMGADQQVVGIDANRSGWTFDTSGDAVNGEIRLHLGLQSASSLFRRPDYFDVKVIAQPDQSLSWSHFIFYATNDHLENNRFVTPDELNLLHPSQLTVNGHPLSVYEIEVRACGTGHNCSDPVSLLIEGNNPLAVDDTLNPTAGGPNVLNPGLWWNPDLAGTGWYFYWSSGLRYPSVHENYGNTYDLIAVWGSYQIINGQWSPIWMYAELKLNDNNESFSGAMYYPQKPTCSVEDDVRDCQENLIHAADLVVQFNEDRNLASLTITHLDVPGMPEIDPSVPLQISNFEISGMCRPTEENCVFGEENPKDYLSGLWGPDTDGDGIFIDEEFIVMNWINLSLEGMMVGFYDSENRPIYALAQSCRDQDEPGMPGHGELEANECERPGTDYLDYISDGIPGNHQNYFYAVDTGFAPTETKPDDYDITQHTFELDPANNGHFAGGGRQFSEENFNLGQAWFNFKYQTTERFATLDYGSPSDLRNIYRGASYNDIRHFIDGEENGHCIDTSANALCEIELTWFTDDYYPNAVVFYQKDQAVPQPIESLCQTVPPYDLVVERYRCVLDQLDDKSGTYRFFLINDRFPGVGWNPEEVIAVSNNLKIGAIGVANLPELEDIAPPLSSNSGQLHSIVAHDPEVGVVAASPGTSGGAATYHIPINLPPGRQGMVPGVALSYNSRGGNGVAGMGWSLATGSSIHRCPMTVAQDGNTIGVQYAETDRLCLDGQRLIRVNGGDYWDNNGEYRTEIDAYARIRMLGGNGQEANALGVGLQFTVEGKDNIYREYGVAVSSQVRPTGAVGATLPAVVSSWMLNLEEDPAGNRVDYQYINFGDGELLLSQIRYTGFGEELGNRAVKFDYQDRIANSDAGSVRDNAESWQAGYFTRQTKRLTTITTCSDVNGCTADGRVREYSLDYIASNATQRLLLSQVTECAYLDGVAECLRPTTFEWNSIQPHYSFEKLADSGGAYIDSSGFEYDGAEGWGQNDFAAPDIDILGDYNGDGVREMRMSIDGKAYLVGVNANGDILGKMRLSNGVAAALTSYRYRGDQDFNDDGRSDFLVAIPNETTPSDPDDYVYAIAQWKAGGTWSDCESQSESCNLNMMFDVRPTDVTTNIIEGQEGPGVGDPDDNNDENLVIRLPANTPHIADFNGDGQKDFLVLGENNQLQLYINVESDAAVRTQTTASIPFAGPFIVESPQFESNGSGSSLLTYRQPQLSDFDGDGAVDILIQADPSSTIDPRDQINAGMAAVVFNDLQRSSVTITEGMPSDALTAYFDDIRVVSDFIERLPDNVSYPQIDLAFDPLLNYYLPVDINGDGLQDFVYMDGGGSGVCLTVTNADGTHPNRSWFYQLNTGHRDHLFTAQVDTNSCVGIERVSGAIGIPSPTYAGLTQTVDWNNDGRGDLMVPRQIHEAVCYLPGQFASNEEAVSYCPAQPDGSGWEQLTCPQGSDVCDLYRSGKGSQDRSTYKMSVLEFTADENGVYRIEERTSDETGLVSARGMRGDDLFGDGLNNVYGAVGCIESPVIGPNGPSLSNRCDITPLAGQYPYSHLFGGLSDTGRGYYQNRLQVAFPQFALDLLSLAEDGFNNETLWEYLPLSAERVSSETSMPLYSLPDRDSGDSLYDYQSEHYFYFQSSMYVVSKMETTNGLVANGEDQTNRTYYGYEEAVFNNQGRGFQGFRKILSEDHIRTPDAGLDNPANDLRTVSFFHQVFPLAGRLHKSVVFPADTPLSAPESQALSVSATSWACRNELGALVVECGIATDTAPSSQEANVYQVLVSDTHTISREPNTGENYNSSSSFNRSYDAYGNLLAETTQSGDYIGSMLFPALIQQQQSSYEYTNNTSSWWLGRLDRQVSTSTVTYSRDLALNESGFADAQASKTTTQVMSWNSILRKPSCVLNVAADYSDTCSSTPSGVQFSRIRTQYEATGIPSAMYGNPTRITVAANDPSQDNGLIEERVTSTSYSNDGYFVASVSNALGHETQTTVEPREGNPMEMVDTNGQRVRMEYDAFGREVRNWFPRVAHADFDDTDNHYAPRTSMGYQLASESSCQVAGLNIAEAVYCVRQHTDGAPQQLQLIDRLNRTWASATSGFNNEGTGRRWSVAQNQYNARGQMAKEAAPRYLGDTVYWTNYTYDVLARPVQKTQPRHAGVGATVPVDDLLTYYAHDGLQTRITVGDRIPNDTNTCKTANAGDDLSAMFCVERVYSSGGQLLRTRDAHGEWTEYRHDSQGYPAFIRDVEFNRIYAEYNAFGQRLAMNDPNQGDWVFSYNGLGELVNQTDARNINIRFSYDRLGRLTERDAGQGQFQRVVDRWTYDNDASVSGNRTVRGLLGREVRDLMIGGTNQAPLFQRIYDRRHRYDSDLRPAGHSTTVNPRQAADPKTYLATVQNDPYFARPFAMTWPGQHIRLYNAYDDQGYLVTEGHSEHFERSDEFLRRVVSMSPVGQVEKERYGNGSEQFFAYHPSTWQMRAVSAGVPASASVQPQPYFDIDYRYDLYGNL
ncbi:MAG: FG-GAP-like repeat-containing protein, partial [Xanthomonadales bacterium]|nr:FG-GAP-like repeat-containing protein [Xanthomonadales bacterium]